MTPYLTRPIRGVTIVETAKMRGFTLIEMMIVVVILSIIVGFAYPNYTRYVIETRRSDGQAAAVQLAAQLEKYFTQCGTYTTTLVGGNISSCSGLGLVTANSPSNNYTLSVAAAGPSGIAGGYQINAQPIGAQANDSDCLALTLTSTGIKGQTGPNAQNRCWRQ